MVARKPRGTTLIVVNGWSYDSREFLGGGGNGDVFRAEKDGRVGALKLLKINLKKLKSPSIQKRIDRFRDEVEALKNCADIPGVIPVFEADTAPRPNQRPWLVMGLATPLAEQLGKSPSLRDVVRAFHDIAAVLETMHGRRFSHRDIKPENLFYYQGRWTVGDFGLVSFEGKVGITEPNERIGPLFYSAPEMLNTAIEADGRPADVFSIAKTIWVLATGQRFALPGAYDLNHEAFQIGTYLPAAENTAPLDKLIASATAFSPENRPTMSQVRAELHAWLSPSKEQNLAIKFDTSKFNAHIDRNQRSMDIEASREAQRQAQLASAAQRVRESLSLFTEDVVTGLKDAKLHTVTHAWNKNDHSLTIRGSIPGITHCGVVLRIGVDDLQPPNLKVTGRTLLEWKEAPAAQLLLWNEEAQFLEAGSEEPLAIERLQLSATAALHATLEQAFIMSLAQPTSAPQLESYTFNIIDSKGASLAGADVCLVNSDGASFNGRTDEQGRVVIGPHSLIAPIAFVAHPFNRGAVLWSLLENNKVELSSSSGDGSFISSGAGHYWPELKTRLNLIHHELNRSYMYASDGVIDHGVHQPGHIALGRQTHIKDKPGNTISICPQAVRGEVFLVNVIRLST